MRPSTFLPPLFLHLTLSAQTEVRQTTCPFSDGSHPTFVVVFDSTDASDLESWYKGQLKDLSKDVESKKEVRATGARVPEVAPDTITVLCRAEHLRKSTTVNLHLAFRVNGAYVAATSDKSLIDGAKNFCYGKAVSYKKLLLQEQLEEKEETLARLWNELAILEKDRGRYEEGIRKNQEKGTKAGQDKLQAEADLKANELAVQGKRNEVATSPSEANTEALQALLKEQTKLKDRIDRLGHQSVDAEKRVKDLEYNIGRNQEDQEVKRKSIELWQQKVEQARTAILNVN